MRAGEFYRVGYYYALRGTGGGDGSLINRSVMIQSSQREMSSLDSPLVAVGRSFFRSRAISVLLRCWPFPFIDLDTNYVFNLLQSNFVYCYRGFAPWMSQFPTKIKTELQIALYIVSVIYKSELRTNSHSFIIPLIRFSLKL